MEEITLKIDGMHCKGCALGIEEEVEALDMVQKVEVDFEKKEAHITYIPDGFDLQKVKDIIAKLGFEVVE